MKHTRGALALSSVALTLSVLATGVPHALADPYPYHHSGSGIAADANVKRTDQEPPRSATETLATVAIGCGVLALGSLAFFVITDCGRGDDD